VNRAFAILPMKAVRACSNLEMTIVPVSAKGRRSELVHNQIEVCPVIDNHAASFPGMPVAASLHADLEQNIRSHTTVTREDFWSFRAASRPLQLAWLRI
jgi:hypothetical protein